VKRSAFFVATGAAFAAASAASRAFAPQRMVRRLQPVTVALDDVTRTTVGLRPYRASGFVLAAEGADRQTIVHNYGHGGGGMSLSWGTALLARSLALASGKRSAAVIGCGVIGLSTARVLQDAGFSVTVYARDLPPLTTSNMSGAQWSPTSVYETGAADAAFLSRFVEASALAQARYQTLLGDDYGVRWIENYSCYDVPGRSFLDNLHPGLRPLYPDVAEYGPGEHPFPTRYAVRFLTMIIEPNRYLRALLRDVQLRGGRVVVREFADVAQIRTLDENLVVNCTGLGARALFGDTVLEPVRGQLSVLAPQPGIDYLTLTPIGYMFPRSDGIVLGGTFDHGNWSTEPDPGTRRHIVGAHQQFFDAMRRNETTAQSGTR
jgi:glycine/D-amino acid oxidase-like deaminating enzyme